MKPFAAFGIARVFLLAAALACSPAPSAVSESSSHPLDAPAAGRSLATLSGFVENRGQWSPEVLFFAREGGVEATLLRNALVLRPGTAPGGEPAPPPIVLRLPGSGGSTRVEGADELVTRHSFFLGSRSASDVPGFERVVYGDVLPGIDVQVRADGGAFQYDLLVQPGARLEGFAVAVEGAERLEVLGGDLLAMHTPAGVIEQRIGASWQVDGEVSAPIACRFRVLDPIDGAPRFGFEAPGRDPELALVLDPSLVYATYVGGANQELLEEMVVDAAGSVYLLCRSTGATPTTPGAFQPSAPGIADAWVGKLSPDGSTLEWGTFLGGSDVEVPAGMAVDADGTVVVAGHTWSSDFPTTAGSLQPVFAGVATKSDVFVTRLDSTGSSLVWSTFYGGSDYEHASAAALFPSGDVLVAGDSLSLDLPATPGAFDEVYDDGDQMLFRLSAEGTSLVFQTYFRGGIEDIAIDAASNVYFAGGVTFFDVPTTPGAFKETKAPGDPAEGFVTKMDAAGTQLFWSTYLGGDEGSDRVWGIAVDAASAVYVAGQTSSGDFPVTPGAFDPTISLGYKGFITKLLPGGTGLIWSTYLGPTCGCGGSGYTADLAVDAAGNVHAVGWANEPGWPTTPDAFQPSYIGPFPKSDAALTKLDSFGEDLVHSTWFGGSGTDYFSRVGLDGSAHPHLAFESFSGDIPVTPGAYDPTYAGSTDVVVAEFDLTLLPWEVLGGGLVGSADTPNLAGAGDLTPGTTTRLSVRGAAPNASAWGVAGFSQQWTPFLGGTLVPSPDFLVQVTTDASGALDATFSWPGLAPGTTLVFQIWIRDPGAPQGWSATNGLVATAQ